MNNYQDWNARTAWAQYVRECRWRAFRRLMTEAVWPCIAIALVIWLNWRLP